MDSDILEIRSLTKARGEKNATQQQQCFCLAPSCTNREGGKTMLPNLHLLFASSSISKNEFQITTVQGNDNRHENGIYDWMSFENTRTNLKSFFTGRLLRDFPLWMYDVGRGFLKCTGQVEVTVNRVWKMLAYSFANFAAPTSLHQATPLPLFPELRAKFWMGQPDSCERKKRTKWVDKEIVLFRLRQPWVCNDNWSPC